MINSLPLLISASNKGENTLIGGLDMSHHIINHVIKLKNDGEVIGE
jgi:hypothetical protein